MDVGTISLLVTVAFGVVTVILAAPPLLKMWNERGSKAHWTTPLWTVEPMKIGTVVTPVLTARWEVRGPNASIQGVEMAVQGPSGKWKKLAYPKGNLVVPKSSLQTYIDMTTETPFSTVVSSPADIGKPVRSTVELARKGRYKLRIYWYENDRPKRRHEKVFSHFVK
jgi:hypothetical protein